MVFFCLPSNFERSFEPGEARFAEKAHLPFPTRTEDLQGIQLIQSASKNRSLNIALEEWKNKLRPFLVVAISSVAIVG